MSKPRTLVPLDLVSGVDTEKDERRVGPPNWLAAQNGVFKNPGEVALRPPFSNVGLGVGALSQAKGVAGFDDQVLLFKEDEAVVSTFNKAHPFFATEVDLTPVYDTADDASTTQSATSGSTVVTTWTHPTTLLVNYVVTDKDTGTVYQVGSIASSVGYGQLVAVGENIFLIFFDAGSSVELTVASFIPTDPTLAPVVDRFAGEIASNSALFSIALDPGTDFVLIAYRNAGGTRLLWMQDGGEGEVPVITNAEHGRADPATSTEIAIDYAMSVGIAADGSEYAVGGVGTLNSTANQHGFYTYTSKTAFTIVSRVHSARAAVSPLWYNSCLAFTADSIWLLYISEGVALTSGYAYRIRVKGALAESIFLHNCLLQSRPFWSTLHGKNFMTVLLSYTGGGDGRDLNNTHFLVDLSGTPVCSWLTNKAKPSTALLGSAPPAGVTPLGSEEYALVTLDRRLTSAVAGDGVSTDGGFIYTTLKLDVLPQPATQLGSTLYIPGPLPHYYDGKSVGTLPLTFAPAPYVTLDVGGGSGGLNPNGSFGYLAVYRQRLSSGEEYRTLGIPTVEDFTATGALADRIEVEVFTYPFSDDVTVELYRTAKDKSFYYLVDEQDNDTTAETLTFYDNVTDTVLEANRPYYGDVEIKHVPPAGWYTTTAGAGRIFFVDNDLRTRVWVSKEHINGRAASFSDALTFEVEPSTGPITALAVLDSTLIIFKRDRAYGLPMRNIPNNAGGGGFSTPQLITSEVGCNNQRSVVRIPDGLMFQSDLGIYHLSRSFATSFIGAPVSAYTAAIQGAVVRPDKPEVWLFPVAGAPVLIYNFRVGGWTTGFFDDAQANAALSYRGSMYIAESVSGALMKLNPAAAVGSHSDLITPTGSAYGMTLVTPWVATSGLQGRQIVDTLLALGDFDSLGEDELTVSVGYDYSDSYAYSFTWPGATNSSQEFRHKLRKQKCRAVRFKLATASANYWALTQLALLVAPEEGVARLDTTTRTT